MDAAILTLPDDSVAGGPVEAGLFRRHPSGAAGGLATSDKKIKENPDQVRRMARGFVRSLNFARTNRNASVEFIMKQWKVDRKVAGSSYDLLVKSMSPDGRAPEKLILDLVARVKKLRKINREISFSQVADFSFVREAGKH